MDAAYCKRAHKFCEGERAVECAHSYTESLMSGEF